MKVFVPVDRTFFLEMNDLSSGTISCPDPESDVVRCLPIKPLAPLIAMFISRELLLMYGMKTYFLHGKLLSKDKMNRKDEHFRSRG